MEELSVTVKGRDYITGLPRSVELRTNEIVKAIAKELRDMIKAIKDVLQDTPPELASDLVDRGIVLAGGGSLLDGLDRLLAKDTGLPVRLAEDPLLCVVKGAGKVLERIDFFKEALMD